MTKEKEVVTSNQVEISGRVNSELEFSHEYLGKKFYIFFLASDRLSETKDVIPVMVSERCKDIENVKKGNCVHIKGQFRSYSKQGKIRRHLILYVFAKEISLETDLLGEKRVNKIKLKGYVGKPVNYRKTPLGKDIADILLAVNRNNGKSDYIPCIAWREDAKQAEQFQVGDEIVVSGRVQSREYYKELSETEVEKRVAYEVSCKKLRKVNK